jgi:hypothetical protein
MDRFVVVVKGAAADQVAEAEEIIQQAGAEEIRHVEQDE